MGKEKRKMGLISQVAILFAVAIVATGILTYFVLQIISEGNVKSQTETQARENAKEVIPAVNEYPAHEWLIQYWYEHPDDMDIDYDAEFENGNKTDKQTELFSKRHPDIQLRYATTEEIEALPAKDQKLYAEITYSWLITRINQVKRIYNVSFVFGVISDDPYDKQFFLFSAADENSIRGTEYEQVYPLGVEVEVGSSQQDAMANAKERTVHLANAGKYMDYYEYMGSYDGHDLFIGMTYDVSALMKDINSQTWLRTSIALLFQICLAVFCLALIFIYVLKPLKTITASIREYKENKDSKIVKDNLDEINSRNEIGDLSEDIIELSEEIDHYLGEIETISAEKQRISAELALAARIQARVLPSTFPPFPGRDEFDIYASMKPAKEVGGDFYDFFMVDDDHLALVIADVSGKGIPAALFMMVSKIIMKNVASNESSPATTMGIVNEQICANNPEEMFVSVWLGVLEISTGKLTTSSAGHEYPVVMQSGGRFKIVKDRHGFVLGGMEGMAYQEEVIQMKPGSKIFVYTDGVPEATNKEGKMYGMDRLVIALNENPEASVKEVLHNVKVSVNGFAEGAEQFDDLTMMCLMYNGPEEKAAEEERAL